MRFMLMLMAIAVTQLSDEPRPWTPTSWVELFSGFIDFLEQNLELPAGADPMESYGGTCCTACWFGPIWFRG